MRGARLIGLSLAAVVVVALSLGTALTAPDTSLPWSLPGGGGGGTGSSTNFEAGYSAGQTAIGQAESTAFRLGAGYWYGGRDQDGDLLALASDPCPTVADCDSDGWKDGSEARFIGTDPLDACPDNAGDSAWPADINNDTFIDTQDISVLTNVFGASVPAGAPPRYDIGPDPPDGFVDTQDIVRLTGLFGQGCGP